MPNIKTDITEPIYLKHLVAITTALIATGNYTQQPDDDRYGVPAVFISLALLNPRPVAPEFLRLALQCTQDELR